MNSLFTGSWVKNTALLVENNKNAVHLLMEDDVRISKVLKRIKKIMGEVGAGVPYRDVRLFLYEFLLNNYFDKIPEDFVARFVTRKPEGKDVNALWGGFDLDQRLPKNFKEDVAKKFDEFSTDENVKEFINRVIINRMWTGIPMGGKPKVFKGTKEIEDIIKMGGVSAKERFEKGGTGHETLTKNLDPDTELNYEEDSPMQLPIYTAMKNGLRYRVTLKEPQGDKVKVKQVKPENLSSLVITDPTAKQMIKSPTLPGIDAPVVKREKPVADFPSGEKEIDFEGPDPEELAYGGKGAKEELYGGEAPEKPVGSTDDDVENIIDTGTEPENTEDEVSPSDSDIEDVEKEKPSYGSSEDEPEDTAGDESDYRSRRRDFEYDYNPDDEEEESVNKKPKVQITIENRKSPQQIQRELLQQIRIKRQNQFKNERRNTLGY
jgi:hypothetical protein